MKYFIKSIVPKSFLPALLNTYYRLRTPFYKGSTVHCPCCSGNFTTFVSFNSYGTIRRNVQCPKCGSLERHRLLWLYLKERTNILVEKKRMLHIAPEAILQTQFKSTPSLDYISADIASPLAMVKMNIEKIPYEDNYIDVILCFHVLDHVNNDKAAMREFFRVLKPGGWAIIQSAIDNTKEHTFENPNAQTKEERLEVFGQVDLARKYGLDFTQRLIDAGFEVDELQYGNEQTAFDIKRYGLREDEVFYLCTKINTDAVA